MHSSDAHEWRRGAPGLRLRLEASPGAEAALMALSQDPAVREAICAALWIGGRAGRLSPADAAALLARGREMTRVEAEALAPHRAALRAAGDARPGPETAALAEALDLAERHGALGRIAAMGGWGAAALPPPGPGAMEENAARVLAAAEGEAGAAAQFHLGALVEAAEAEAR